MIAAPIQNGISRMPLYTKGPASSDSQENAYEKQIKRKELRKTHIEVTSLHDLISKLHEEFDKNVIDVDYVNEIMTAYKSDPREWKKYAKFDRYRYTRNLVDSGNGKFNLMILCWGEGHGSAIHDHADAHCFMKILDGTLSEVRFAYPDGEDKSLAEDAKIKEIGRANLKTNEVCYINDSLGLHRVENPSQVNPAVSLHLYCPPFDACSIFNQQTGKRSKCSVTFWSKYGESREKKAQERVAESRRHQKTISANPSGHKDHIGWD